MIKLTKTERELRNQLGTLVDEAKQLANDDKMEDAKAKKAEIDKLKDKIELLSGLEDAIPEEGFKAYAEPKKNEGIKPFANLGEQLKAIKDVANGKSRDERLNRLNNEYLNSASGANEGLPEEGGFPVQTDFASGMMETAAKAGNILPLVDKYTVGANSNKVQWIDIDESSIATTIFGGVRLYWAAEAGEVTATKPKLKERSLELKKLMGVAYATYELEQDSNFISQLYTRAFTLGIQRELENCIISGNGVGKPLGFLNGKGTISIAKESGQTAATIVWKNIVKMYNRALDKTNSKYAWLCHPDCSAEFDFMEFPVGTGGAPVFLQASKIGDVPSLKGHGIVDSDNCSALGTVGDINYVNLNEYCLITKGGVQADTSMHVQFLTAENCFRFMFRANGAPKRETALTIKNSNNTRSPFVTLATRE